MSPPARRMHGASSDDGDLGPRGFTMADESEADDLGPRGFALAMPEPARGVSPGSVSEDAEASSAVVAAARPVESRLRWSVGAWCLARDPVQRQFLACLEDTDRPQKRRHGVVENLAQMKSWLFGSQARLSSSFGAEAKALGMHRRRFLPMLSDCVAAVFVGAEVVCRGFFQQLESFIASGARPVAALTHVMFDETPMPMRVPEHAGGEAEPAAAARQKEAPKASDTKVMQLQVEVACLFVVGHQHLLCRLPLPAALFAVDRSTAETTVACIKKVMYHSAYGIGWGRATSVVSHVPPCFRESPKLPTIEFIRAGCPPARPPARPSSASRSVGPSPLCRLPYLFAQETLYKRHVGARTRLDVGRSGRGPGQRQREKMSGPFLVLGHRPAGQLALASRRWSGCPQARASEVSTHALLEPLPATPLEFYMYVSMYIYMYKVGCAFVGICASGVFDCSRHHSFSGTCLNRFVVCRFRRVSFASKPWEPRSWPNDVCTCSKPCLAQVGEAPERTHTHTRPL